VPLTYDSDVPYDTAEWTYDGTAVGGVIVGTRTLILEDLKGTVLVELQDVKDALLVPVEDDGGRTVTLTDGEARSVTVEDGPPPRRLEV
jgi:hypothetical protein